jgi:cytoskeleton protein RodZ
MPALGERFRTAREARGLTLSDVAEHIRIRSVYLAAIEDQNWNAIGAPVYIRGFLRTYARFLGLDPEEVVNEFHQGNSVPSPSHQAASAAPVRSGYLGEHEAPSRSLSPLIWIASMVAVVLIAFVFYNEATMRARGTANVLPSNTATQVTASTSPPALAAAATAPPLAQGTPVTVAAQTLELRVSAPSWLRVTVDGNVSMEGTFPAGTVRRFHGKTASLRIGNAGGVEVVVDGRSLGRLGPTGDVVDRSFAL